MEQFVSNQTPSKNVDYIERKKLINNTPYGTNHTKQFSNEYNISFKQYDKSFTKEVPNKYNVSQNYPGRYSFESYEEDNQIDNIATSFNMNTFPKYNNYQTVSTGGHNYNIISQQNELNKNYYINSKIKEVPTKYNPNLTRSRKYNIETYEEDDDSIEKANNIAWPDVNNDKTVRIGSPIKYKNASIPNAQSTRYYMNTNPLSFPARNYISTTNVNSPISHRIDSIPVKYNNNYKINSHFVAFSPYRNDIKTVNDGYRTVFIPHQPITQYNIITHPITYHNTSNNISTVGFAQHIRKNMSIPNDLKIEGNSIYIPIASKNTSQINTVNNINISSPVRFNIVPNTPESYTEYYRPSHNIDSSIKNQITNINVISPTSYTIVSNPSESNIQYKSQIITSPIRNNLSTIRISSPIKYNIVSIPPKTDIQYNITSNRIISPINNNISSIKISSPIRYNITSNQSGINTGFNNIYNSISSPIKNNITTVKITSPIRYNIISNPPESKTSNIVASPLRNKITSNPIPEDSTPSFNVINSYKVDSKMNDIIAPYPYDSQKKYNIISNNINSKLYDNIPTTKITSQIRYNIFSNQSQSNIGYNIISHEQKPQIDKKYPHDSVSSPKRLNYTLRLYTPLRRNINSYSMNSFRNDSSSRFNISMRTPRKDNYSIKSGNDSYKFYPMDSITSPLIQNREIILSRTLTPLHNSLRNSNNFGKLYYKPKDFRKREIVKVKKLIY